MGLPLYHSREDHDPRPKIHSENTHIPLIYVLLHPFSLIEHETYIVLHFWTIRLPIINVKLIASIKYKDTLQKQVKWFINIF